MSKIASVGRSVLCVAIWAILTAAASAAEPAPGVEQAPNGEAPPAPELECYDKAVTGSGPGFSSSRDHSEKAAKEEWLVKAKEVFADATWETAKDKGLTCAVQGLYSKCFATGVPCHPKEGATPEPPKSE
jgi:hypothetical protein